MSEFLTVLVIAFLAQLAVLPGEKVQFIIAGLSTRYHPLGVVAAASLAFAGWTALEIWFATVLRSALSPVILDAITAAMFLVFAYLLVRAAPEAGRELTATPDGGVAAVDELTVPVVDREIPDVFGDYVPIFVLLAAGEFGDKTQLVTVSLAVQYGATAAIWLGEMLAIVPVSLLNAYFFHRFVHRFDLRTAHFAAAAMFAFFGLDTILAMVTGFSVWEYLVGAVTDLVLAAV